MNAMDKTICPFGSKIFEIIVKPCILIFLENKLTENCVDLEQHMVQRIPSYLVRNSSFDFF